MKKLFNYISAAFTMGVLMVAFHILEKKRKCECNRR